MLSYDELTTIISRFSSSIYKLEKSGDYPERKSDREIMTKLLDLQWRKRKEETNMEGN